MERKSRWESIYATKGPTEISWFQREPSLSLDLIESTGAGKEAVILDAGGGASTLADHLVQKGYRHPWVVDISARALGTAKSRMGPAAGTVTWMEGDLTQMFLPHQFFDIWHDRAVFHFLTSLEERMRYIKAMTNALKPAGHVIMATFALDGPERCSGLEVVRYSAETLSAELGNSFQLLKHLTEAHQTPFAAEQKFVYCLFKRA